MVVVFCVSQQATVQSQNDSRKQAVRDDVTATKGHRGWLARGNCDDVPRPPHGSRAQVSGGPSIWRILGWSIFRRKMRWRMRAGYGTSTPIGCSGGSRHVDGGFKNFTKKINN